MPDHEGRTTEGKEGSVSTKPFWQNPALITAVAALIASVIPITAAINGFATFQLEKQRQIEQTRLQYLDRAIRPGQDAADRKAILQFIVNASAEGFTIGTWADSELKKIAAAEAALAASAEAASNLESFKLAQAVADKEGGGTDSGQQWQADLQQRYAALQKENVEARKKLSEASSRAGVVFPKADLAPSTSRLVEDFRASFHGDLGFIQQMEGHAGSPYWWGPGSGVTLDPGLDLGRADRDTVVWAYGESLTADQLAAVLDLIGVRGEAAKEAVDKPPIKDIRISRSEASRVLAIVVRPMWNILLKRFPRLGQADTPGAVQTAVLSLAFNRGASNRALDPLANPIESGDWRMVAEQIGSMQQNHRLQSIRERRRLEAELIRNAVSG